MNTTPSHSEDMRGERDQPLDRAMAILRAVSQAAGPSSLTDIATACDLPAPTVHRLVAQLEQRGFLKRPPGSKRLVVGHALVQLANDTIEAAARNDRARQILISLANDIGEHCQLGVRSGNDVLYVDAAQSARSSGLQFEHGKRAPLYCTSIGKLFLADMPPEDFDAWLSLARLEPHTAHTATTAQAMRTLVAKVRASGWATSNEELAAGVVGCAVPVRGRKSLLLAGLGISVPSARVAYAELERFRAPMEAAAAEISAELIRASGS